MKKSLKIVLVIIVILICIGAIYFILTGLNNPYPAGSIELPGGGLAVPVGSNGLNISYDQCVKTSDDQLKDMCARKFAIEKKDPGLCRSLWAGLIGTKSPYDEHTIITAADVLLQQNTCLYSYAIAYHDITICQSMDSSPDSVASYKNLCLSNVSKVASSTSQ